MLRFTATVFRPGAAWAERLTHAMTAVLWIGWAVYAMQGGLGDGSLRGRYWLAFGVIGTYPIWSGIESIRSWRQMRRRLALGLAGRPGRRPLPALGPGLVLRRLLDLGGQRSDLRGRPPSGGAMAPLTAGCMVATAVFGLVTVGCYGLTFFPPRWYRARLERGPRLAAAKPSPAAAGSL